MLAACASEEPPASLDVPPPDDLLDRITRSADDGSVHLVRIVHRPDRYQFEPARLTIASGDLVRFVMTGSLPESIVFDPLTATPEAAAFIRGRSLNLGVLLVDPGQSHDFSFQGAPPGIYPFLSIPHSDRGMTGSVEVIEQKAD